MAHEIEPIDQLLREACARMAARFRWADDFDAVMKDRVRSRMVRLAARHPSAAGVMPARAPRAPACRPTQQPSTGLPPFDHKRAASGERDDD
ncbi:hypothetical protein SAMN05518800_3202 [Variovorax sp. YR752]|uniref:hypothetical protein n=1 Tax=Variovorax sp. YR752 TaxID=1884383 RepID=UPI000BCB89DA|nr:hypothetical protein [Variovorax sp. YR752]SOD27638.1 hypothetical protein SAMN05518800_3202 [Variovorax sp. YR752]